MTMPSNGLTITRISAENILRYQTFSLSDIGKVTLFRGPNDVGKTTALKLLSLAVTGSPDPRSIIHDGAEKGEIVLDFLGYKLRRSFTEAGSYLKITDDEGRVLPKPQQWLTDRVGEFRDFNPLAWLSLANSDSAEERRRAVGMLLRAINVTLSEAEFTAITGLDAPFDVDFTRHGLVVLDALREHFAEERKSENKNADQKRKAAAEARVKLPAERPVITEDRRAQLDKTDAAAQNARATLEARKLAAKQHAAAVDRLDREIAREESGIGELEAENNRLRALISKNDEKMAQARARQVGLHREREDLAASAPPTDEDLRAVERQVGEVQVAKLALAADEAFVNAFETIERVEQEANDAAVRASILDTTIKTIDGELRAKLMEKAKLPVGSLTIAGDRISVDGHPLANAAESKQIRVALAMARALSPKLKVIILDGSERLDAATFATFLEETRGDGFLYFASEVDRYGSLLEVITFGEDGAESPAVAEVA